jgi:hypothetical protein
VLPQQYIPFQPHTYLLAVLWPHVGRWLREASSVALRHSTVLYGAVCAAKASCHACLPRCRAVWLRSAGTGCHIKQHGAFLLHVCLSVWLVVLYGTAGACTGVGCLGGCGTRPDRAVAALATIYCATVDCPFCE